MDDDFTFGNRLQKLTRIKILIAWKWNTNIFLFLKLGFKMSNLLRKKCKSKNLKFYFTKKFSVSCLKMQNNSWKYFNLSNGPKQVPSSNPGLGVEFGVVYNFLHVHMWISMNVKMNRKSWKMEKMKYYYWDFDPDSKS